MLRLWKKILIIVVIIIAIIYVGTFLFVKLKGKAILIEKVQALIHKKVSVASLSLSPLFNLQIEKLSIEGLAKIDKISVSPSILGMLRGGIALNKVMIVRPEIFLERNAPKAIDGAVISGETPVASLPGTASLAQVKRPLRFSFKRLNISNGKINFIDRTVNTGEINITIRGLNFNLTNHYSFPASVITRFELKGRIPWQKEQEDGKISAQGWLNFTKKDIQATLKIEDIDGIALYPYYSTWVDLEKARIEKAKLKFTSNIQGLDNEVTANCHLELTDIVRKPRPEDEPAEKAEKIANAVLDIFKSMNQGVIALDFTIKTKMDKPEFGFLSIRNAFEDKLTESRNKNSLKTEDIVMFPGKVLGGTVKGAVDLTKAVIDGTFAVGNELKRALEDSFRREKKVD